MSATILDLAVAPLDAARRLAFTGAQRLPWFGRVVARRDARVLAQSSVGVVALFAATLAAPGLLLVLGPALFGVAHVASDVRYLVVRRGLPRAWVRVVGAACALLILSRVVEIALPGALPFARIEVATGWGWAVLGALIGARLARSPKRLALVMVPLFALAAAAVLHPTTARLLFAYAHNLVAVLLWALLFRRRLAYALPALALIALGTYLLVSGAAFPLTHFAGPWVTRFVSETFAAVPRGVPQRLALGIGLSYLFLQSVHYSTWLAWVPQEDLRTEGTLSFRMSVRSLIRDFGPVGLALTVLAVAAVAGATLVSPHRTRGLYLSVASFHGYLELAMLAFFLARGPRQGAPGEA